MVEYMTSAGEFEYEVVGDIVTFTYDRTTGFASIFRRVDNNGDWLRFIPTPVDRITPPGITPTPPPGVHSEWAAYELGIANAIGLIPSPIQCPDIDLRTHNPRGICSSCGISVPEPGKHCSTPVFN